MPARDRIVSRAMMGGGAFILLKGGQAGPESTKQVENRVAVLRKILRDCLFWGRKALAKASKTCNGCI
jgi:hypothetical protein